MADSWWTLAAPVLQGLGVVLALVLGAANLGWLVLQGRQARETRRIAVEAHEWARERRDRELATEREEAERDQWWRERRDAIAQSDGPILLPANANLDWVAEGERRGYFRRTVDVHGDTRLAKPDSLAAAREQRKAERRAQLAEESLLAINSACWLVHHWAAVLCMETTQDRGSRSASLEGIRSAVAFGAGAVDSGRQQIRDVLRRALVHLNDAERQLLSDAEGLLAQNELEANAWLKESETIDRSQARDAFMRVYRSANELELRSKRLLAPVA